MPEIWYKFVYEMLLNGFSLLFRKKASEPLDQTNCDENDLIYVIALHFGS